MAEFVRRHPPFGILDDDRHSWRLLTGREGNLPPWGRILERIRISFFCYPCSPLSRDQGGAQGSEGKQVDPGGRVWYSHLPWHTTDSGSTKTPSSRSSAITGGPSSSAIRATRIATCRPLSTKCLAVAPWRRAI